ncbi:SDR family NAD(P)-dependent oxidoreductase [Bradyrhizobium sp. USDA 4506]
MILKDKVALVVGGSEDIGRAISITLADQGAATAICSRPRQEAPEILAELRRRGREAMWAPADMLDPAAMVSAVDQVVERYGKLDILVVSGAPATYSAALFEITAPADYSRIMESQIISRLNCLHAALKPMITAGYGKVVFLNTDAGRTPSPGSSISGAATAGLMFFVRAGGRELARKGIRLNCIGVPLTAETEDWNKYKSGDASISPVHVRAYAKAEANTPFRMTVPLDLANTVLFLASPQSDQISGAVISVSGGLAFP